MSGLALRLAALEWVFQVISERALSIDPRVGARFRDISNHIAHMQADRTSEAECAAYERMVQDMAAACQAAMRPPALAEWLLAWFMSKAQRDDVLGDLEEEFLTDKLPVLGPRAARLWYWSQIVKSIWPLVRAALLRISTLNAIVSLWRRFGG